MSFKHLRQAFDLDLPRRERYLLLEMANCADEQTGECRPSYEYLMERTKYHKSQVRQGVMELAKERYIMVLEFNKRNQPKRYRLSLEPDCADANPHGYALCLPNADDGCVLCLPNPNGCALCSNGCALCSADYIRYPRVLDPIRDPIEERETASDTDTRTGEPTEPSTDSLSPTDASKRPEAPSVACQPDNPQHVCDCVRQGQEALAELLGYTPSVHPHLHGFVHAYSQEDLRILVRDRLKHEKNESFLKVPTMLSPKKAPDDLAWAKKRLAERQRDPSCMHVASQVVYDEGTDAFVCRGCWKTLSETQARARGVEKHQRLPDEASRSGLDELAKAIGTNRTDYSADCVKEG